MGLPIRKSEKALFVTEPSNVKVPWLADEPRLNISVRSNSPPKEIECLPRNQRTDVGELVDVRVLAEAVGAAQAEEAVTLMFGNCGMITPG